MFFFINKYITRNILNSHSNNLKFIFFYNIIIILFLTIKINKFNIVDNRWYLSIYFFFLKDAYKE